MYFLSFYVNKVRFVLTSECQVQSATDTGTLKSMGSFVLCQGPELFLLDVGAPSPVVNSCLYSVLFFTQWHR